MTMSEGVGEEWWGGLAPASASISTVHVTVGKHLKPAHARLSTEPGVWSLSLSAVHCSFCIFYRKKNKHNNQTNKINKYTNICAGLLKISALLNRKLCSFM